MDSVFAGANVASFSICNYQWLHEGLSLFLIRFAKYYKYFCCATKSGILCHMSDVLYYVHDPMCSWCWGFRPVWEDMQKRLPATLEVKYVLGGLAPDNDQLMPEALQKTIQAHWSNIEEKIPGTGFNHDFWTQCSPRRSTYPACRAVIAARECDTDAERAMILAIQQAYYLEAKNPSNDDVLINCAEKIGLGVKKFSELLTSESVRQQLSHELNVSRQLGVKKFPSLVFKRGGEFKHLQIDYNSAENILQKLR